MHIIKDSHGIKLKFIKVTDMNVKGHADGYTESWLDPTDCTVHGR